MKILLLGSQHGNEPLGDLLYSHLTKYYTHLLPHITFKIGNPRAHEANLRYIESDLNRSYNGTLHTYEAKQAQHLIKFIQEGDFDLILDLHTTVCDQPPCFILPELNDTVTPFIRASHIKRIVLLTDPIVYTSLTGVMPKAVAIEVANSQLTPKLMDKLCQDIERFVRGNIKPTLKKIYEVPRLLLKTEVTPELAGGLVNFKRTGDGYIPIMVGTGADSYSKTTHYLGFKAVTETDITL